MYLRGLTCADKCTLGGDHSHYICTCLFICSALNLNLNIKIFNFEKLQAPQNEQDTQEQ